MAGPNNANKNANLVTNASDILTTNVDKSQRENTRTVNNPLQTGVRGNGPHDFNFLQTNTAQTNVGNSNLNNVPLTTNLGYYRPWHANLGVYPTYTAQASLGTLPQNNFAPFAQMLIRDL